MSKVEATEVADGVPVLELLVDVLDELDKVLVDTVVLCLVETLLALVVDTWDRKKNQLILHSRELRG
jgi:hypothetical protein